MTAEITIPQSQQGQDLRDLLKEVFGYTSFRGPQEAIVQHVCAGNDALVLMPTGGGKSLCYQVPAIARMRRGLGMAIVVSPLISLMHDQVGALHEAGIEAAFLNSTLSAEEASLVERRMLRGELTLLYAAPERVTSLRFLAILDALYQRSHLSLFAIDEAHCVSQWGHDFRPEYRALTVLHERYSGVPRMALTATADEVTRADILERLRLQDARAFVSSFDRPNIRYRLVEKRDANSQLLRFILRQHLGEAGIVYCQSRRKVEWTAQMLLEAGIRALPYHAGMDSKARHENQTEFLRSEGAVIVATTAFGMGIDKPDVRFVAHLDMPKNIEGYYQETGRAGRDGLPADAWLCYGLQDVMNLRRMIDESPAVEEYKQLMRGKLDALLGLAETCDCRRVRLLAYFGESSQPCGNCDNCLEPPELWDGTDAARKLLSTIYRVHQSTGLHFGAGFLIDIVRGKLTEKIVQYQCGSLSTFGIGSQYTEQQLRGVMRQLISVGAISVKSGEFSTLCLSSESRSVLRGERTIYLRAAASERRRKEVKRHLRLGAVVKAPISLDSEGLLRYSALKYWRANIAQEHNLPAYLIFHDSTLAAIAQHAPESESELEGISGIGARKRQAYGEAVLSVLRSQANSSS